MKPIVASSGWLLSSIALYQVAGLVVWTVAARRLPEEVVGESGGLFWTTVFLAYSLSLGLTVAVSRHGRSNSDPDRRLFGALVLYRLAASLAGSFAVVLVLGLVSSEALAAIDGAWFTRGGMYVLLAATASLGPVVDMRFLVLQRRGLVLARTTFVVTLRLGAIWLVPVDSLSASWLLWLVLIIPEAISGLLGLVLTRPALPPAPWRPDAPRRHAIRFAHRNYVGQLAAHAPLAIIPFLAAPLLDAADRAAFLIAWTVTAGLFLVPHVLSEALLVEGNHSRALLEHQVALTTRLAVGLGILMTVACAAGAPLIPVLLGDGYRPTARWLPVLVAATIPYSVTAVAVARARVERDLVAAVRIPLMYAVLTVIPATIAAASHELRGVALAWLIGNVVAAAGTRLGFGAAAERTAPERAEGSVVR